MGPLRRFLNALFAVCLLALPGTAAFATDFVVSKTADTADGVCDADCSLREAVIAANAAPGADRIILQSSQTYILTLGPADPSGALVQGSGDLDIVDALTIDGNGSSISAMGLDRVLDIQGIFLVTINNLSIRDGLASGFLSLGGGLNIRLAAVVLNNCVVNNNNTALDVSGNRDNGGAISVVGSYNAVAGIATLAALTLNNTSVGGNTGQNGGGIFCALCALTVSNSTISLNSASGGDGGGIDVVGNASTLSVNSSHLITNNAAGAASRGGGLSVPFGTSVSTLSRNRIVYNTAAFSSAIFDNVGTVTATNNWWGCNFGPGAGGAGCSGTPGVPNGVSGPVTSTPYLVLKTYASPPAIVPNASSTVTADLTFNSANADTSAGGTVPNGIGAAFSGTLGTFATPTSTTANGKAADIYTNSGATGSAGISAVLDGQTATTSLLVAFGLPTVVTGAAGGIGGFGATLNGTANPNGSATNGNFEYGQTILYGSTTPAQAIGSGSGFVAIGGGAISGLACGTLYHFRAAATNGSGTTGGFDATFTTSACVPPVVVTGAASAITRTGALLGGTANPNGTATTASFEYGTTTGYGSTTAGQLLGAGSSDVAIGGGSLTGLRCATLYHFRATATNANGTTTGADATFKTTACTVGDFDGDGKTDLSLFRPSTSTWYVLKSNANYTTYIGQPWGLSTDKAVAGDFDGDGKADLGLYRPSTGTWWVLLSSTNFSTYLSKSWGLSTDIPVPADYDGDGKTDFGLFRPSTGTWYVLLSGANYTTYIVQSWGASTDTPLAGDFDGDGKADLGLYRPSTGTWWVLQSSANFTTYRSQTWGLSTDIAVPGDYDGDGKTDPAVYRPSTGVWYLLQSSTNYTTYVSQAWGIGTDVTVPGDYDGDGKTDLGLFRPSTGTWYLLLSGTNYTTYAGQAWGVSTDTPVLHRP